MQELGRHLQVVVTTLVSFAQELAAGAVLNNQVGIQWYMYLKHAMFPAHLTHSHTDLGNAAVESPHPHTSPISHPHSPSITTRPSSTHHKQ